MSSEKTAQEKLLAHTKVRGAGDCWEWTGPKYRGYGRIYHEGKNWPAHRLMYVSVFGPIPKGMFACHKCDNRWCVNPNHIFLGSPKDNQQDAIRKGRKTVAKGIECPQAKLDPEKVRRIRSMPHKTSIEVGRMFGVHSDTIRKLRRGLSWNHVK